MATEPDDFLFVRNALHASDTLYAYAATRADASRLSGRGINYRIRGPGADWVVRRYRRGGAVAALLGDRYFRLGIPRPWRELRVSEAARERGVRTPRIAAAVVYGRDLFLRADLATEYVPESEDLAQLGFGQSLRAGEVKLRAFRRAGELVRELAGAGIAHSDLNIKNILISFAQPEPEAWVLDLDGGSIRSKVDATTMWRRVQRSIAKWERTSGRALDALQARELEAGFRG